MSTAAASKDSKIVKKDYFRGEKLILKLIGISFTGDEGSAYKIYSFLFTLLVCISYPLLDVRELFVNPFDVVAPMLMNVFYEVEGMIKILVIRRNRLKLGKLMKKMEQKPFLPDLDRGGPVEQKILSDCLRIVTKQAIVYWGFMYAAIGYNTFYSLVVHIKSNNYEDWILPYGTFTVLNITDITNYRITWFYQNFSVWSVSSAFCSIDLLIAGMLAHISFQFKILQNNFKRIVENGYKDMIKEENVSSSSSKVINISGEFDASTIPWKYLKKSLKDAVEYHLAIIDLINEMAEVFSDLLLVVVLSALTVIAFITYHAALLPSIGDGDMAGTIGDVIVNWTQVALVCYWGNEVILDSQKLGNAILKSNVMGADLRFQKDIAFVILRSQTPSKLTAGKFTDISLFTLLWVTRATYSSFTFLRNMR